MVLVVLRTVRILRTLKVLRIFRVLLRTLRVTIQSAAVIHGPCSLVAGHQTDLRHLHGWLTVLMMQWACLFIILLSHEGNVPWITKLSLPLSLRIPLQMMLLCPFLSMMPHTLRYSWYVVHSHPMKCTLLFWFWHGNIPCLWSLSLVNILQVFLEPLWNMLHTYKTWIKSLTIVCCFLML